MRIKCKDLRVGDRVKFGFDDLEEEVLTTERILDEKGVRLKIKTSLVMTYFILDMDDEVVLVSRKADFQPPP